MKTEIRPVVVMTAPGCPISYAKVLVFDLAAIVKDKSDGKFDVVGCSKIALIEGDNGIIVTESDAVHYVLKSEIPREEKITIHIAEHEEGSIQVVPTAKYEVTINELMECKHEELELREFILSPNKSRVKENHQLLNGSLFDINLDPKYYQLI